MKGSSAEGLHRIQGKNELTMWYVDVCVREIQTKCLTELRDWFAKSPPVLRL